MYTLYIPSVTLTLKATVQKNNMHNLKVRSFQDKA